jgi:3-phosphoshikimate 1-carboxyvinyltransferase
VRFEPAARLSGTLRPPPDKSISHRAALFAAMADGPTRVLNYLHAADTEATLAAVGALGADVSRDGGELVIEGTGLRGGRVPERPIDVRNAGTLLRMLPGWLAGQPAGTWTIDGDESIRRRPVDRIVTPLRAMGARIECRDGRLPPLQVQGSPLRAIRYELPVASAQVKSCVLMAGLLAEGETTVVESLPTRDHTERMLSHAGVAIRVAGGDGLPATVSLPSTAKLELGEVTVPGDLSSAAFFAVAATLVAGSELLLERVGVNPTRTGLLSVMERMGARIEVIEEGWFDAEPVADLVVRRSELRGVRVEPGEVPLLIDELPLVALLGAFAHGRTIVSGAEELRHKESDRIATVVEGLRALGADVEATADGFAVDGGGGALEGGTIDSHGDHRLAMLGAVAGLASRDGVEVHGFGAAAVSYPGFAEDLARVRR